MAKSCVDHGVERNPNATALRRKDFLVFAALFDIVLQTFLAVRVSAWVGQGDGSGIVEQVGANNT